MVFVFIGKVVIIELGCISDLLESSFANYCRIHFVYIVHNTMDEEYDVIVLGTGLKVSEYPPPSWPRLLAEEILYCVCFVFCRCLPDSFKCCSQEDTSAIPTGHIILAFKKGCIH